MGATHDEVVEQPAGHRSDVVDGGVEGLFVGARRRPVPADLADELEGGGPDVVVGCGVVAPEGLDAPAHAARLGDGLH